MAKRKNQIKRSSSRGPRESRTTEVLTIGWMLTVFTTLVCELGFAVTQWFSPAEGGMLRVLSGMMLFAALVIGFLSLLLTAVTARSRREPPPRGITVFAVVVGAAPMLIMVAHLLQAP